MKKYSYILKTSGRYTCETTTLDTDHRANTKAFLEEVKALGRAANGSYYTWYRPNNGVFSDYKAINLSKVF